MSERKPDETPAGLTARQARQGEIILRTPARRLIFFGGLCAFALAGIATALA